MRDEAAKNFSLKWSGRGNEDGDYLFFWGDMLRDVFGVADPESFTKRQQDVFFDRATGERAKGKYDIYIPSTKVLIEQKSFGTDLSKRKLQSDGEYATPFEQAKRYAEAMPMSVRPRWIITCNFDEFRIYDLQEMDTLEFLLSPETYAPTVIKLEDFRDKFELLRFIVDPDAKISPEVKISADAAKIVRAICTAIDKKYTERDADYINALSKLCARLVFCFYADDAGLFAKTKFADYLKKFSAAELNDALQKFFDALNTPEAKRDALKDFPYVDGGLFDEHLPIPPLNQKFEYEIHYAHYLKGFRWNEKENDFFKFSWREISPPIFGAMFESLFNDDTRRKAGVYYTDVKNIHKVIDPLFFDDLSHELAEIKRMHKRNRVAALKNFQDKLASLNFLDPACGSGNFLTETYLSLRRLENEVLRELKSLFAEIPANPVKVTPRQFYGIEINDFAVAVAKDALWIAEIQMLRKTSWILGRELPELPLRKYISIHKANALRVDWKKIVAPENISYIIGNPPFVGARLKSAEQARDMQIVFDGSYNIGNLDYVTCWYKKAADYIRGRKIRCAFVSTNSVCQGDSVGALWKNLFAEGIHIDFAHRTFKWLSDSENLAHVHCIVAGFSSAPNPKPKKIFDGENFTIADNINAYLVDGENIFVESRNEHYQAGVPKMRFGSMPNDGGNLIIEADDLDYFLQHEPAAEKYIRLFFGADEFIKSKQRYCLWLDGVTLDEIKKMPLVAERVEAVKNYRSLSKRAATRKLADTPMLFGENRQPTTNYIFIPRITSERRRYIPIGFMNANVIARDGAQTIPDGTIYHFGVLTSSIHMAWVRATCGRLEMRYNYSAKVVYNNFPWCEVTDTRRQTIEHTAQHILDVRKKYPDWTFAALYNESTMPDDLRDAHKLNDMAVALAYGFDKILHDEAQVVAELMKLYKRLTS